LDSSSRFALDFGTLGLDQKSEMSQPILAALAAALLALGGQTALAQNKAGEDVPHPGTENFHAQCIGCHGIPGYKTAFPDVYHVPMIAGQQPGYIVSALKAYKSGDRSHPSMRGIAASLSEEQMQKLADYYGRPAK
jgi:cytochrome c553